MLSSHPHLPRRSMLRLQQLDMLLHLVETRSISATAERLHLTQSAITKSLKDLEATFGVQLFERLATGLTVTRAGSVVERFARTVVQGYRATLAEAHSQDASAHEATRIGCCPGAPLAFLLRSLHDAAPNTAPPPAPAVHVDCTNALNEAVGCGALDFALTYSPTGLGREDLVHTALGTETLVAVARPDHPFAGSPPRESELAQTTWVLPLSDDAVCAAFTTQFDLSRPGGELLIHVSHQPAALELARATSTIAVVSRNVAEAALNSGDVVEISMPAPLPTPRFGLTRLLARRVSIDQNLLVQALLSRRSASPR